MRHLPPNQTCRIRRRSNRGFSLIEVMFAVGMLAIGIVGVLALFTTGIRAAAWSNNMTSAAMEAQNLYARVVGEVDTAGNRVFLCRIRDPKNPSMDPNRPDNEWIQADGNQQAPTQSVVPDQMNPSGGDWWWRCRVTKFTMDPDTPLDGNGDDNMKNPMAKPFPTGLYEIAIAVYRNWSDQHPKPPIVVYTTFVTAGY